jgi:RNA polymerase sigma-70 factor, ECF subfamily
VDGRKPARRVEPWLATICLNLGRDRLRRVSLRSEVAVESLREPAADVDVEAAAIDRVERAQVERALWALSEEQRTAIALMDIVGFTAAEVAAITGSPRGTVLARVHRGRKALARLVAEEAMRREP